MRFTQQKVIKQARSKKSDPLGSLAQNGQSSRIESVQSGHALEGRELGGAVREEQMLIDQSQQETMVRTAQVEAKAEAGEEVHPLLVVDFEVVAEVLENGVWLGSPELDARSQWARQISK